MKDKPRLAKIALEKMMLIQLRHSEPVEPKIYLHLGLVQHMQRELKPAIDSTKTCLIEVGRLLQQRPAEATDNRDWELRKIKVSAQLNMMVYYYEAKKYVDAKEHGLLAQKYCDELLALIAAYLDYHRTADTRGSESADHTSAGLQETHTNANTVASVDSIRQLKVDVDNLKSLIEKKASRINTIISINSKSLLRTPTNRYDLRMASAFRINCSSKPQHRKQLHLNSHNSLKLLTPAGSLNSSMLDSSITLRVQVNPTNIHQKLLSNPQSGIKLRNRNLIEFRNKPFYVLDEFAADIDKKESKVRNIIGKVISNRATTIYSKIPSQRLIAGISPSKRDSSVKIPHQSPISRRDICNKLQQ